MRLRFALVLGLIVACNDAALTNALPTQPPRGDDAGTLPDGGRLPDGGSPDGATPQPSNLRVVAGNISSGASSNYDGGEGKRMLQGLKPDVALLQEMKYLGNGDADMRAFVDDTFGASFSYVREEGFEIPNAVVSRYPIETSGRWADPFVANRGFVYAKIQVPGTHPLWAVSVHFLTTGGADRTNEASSLVGQLQGVAAEGDYIVIGGDLNTDNRVETCVTTLGALVATGAPYPVDQMGNDNTSGPRSRPYDWVLPNPDLQAHRVPTTIGANVFPAGLVFDSRVYTPLADAAPAMATDSGATNMQHMPVVQDFFVE